MNQAPRGNRLWQSVQAEVRKHKWSAVSTPTRWTRKTELKFSSQAQMFFKGICFFDFFVLFDDLILCIDGLSSSPVWYLWKQSTKIKSDEVCFAFVNFQLFHDKEGFPSQNLKSNTSTDIISHVVKILFPGGRREKWEVFINLTNTAKYYLVQEFSSKREDEHFIQSFHISLENLAASIPLFYITNKIMCVQLPPCL